MIHSRLWVGLLFVVVGCAVGTGCGNGTVSGATPDGSDGGFEPSDAGDGNEGDEFAPGDPAGDGVAPGDPG